MYCVWFLTYLFPIVEDQKFRCVITAPEKGTGSEVYDRVKMLFDACGIKWPTRFKFKKKNLDNIITANDCMVTSFGLFKGYASREGKKTTKEGRTFHLSVRDEMHMGDDDIFKDEIEPAMATTGGLDIWIGNGGYRECKAKQFVEGGSTQNVTVFAWDYDIMRKHVLEEYERTGNEMWGRWVQSQDYYIEENGSESDVVKKNLYLEWLVTVGSYVDWNKFIGFRRMTDPQEWTTNLADAGVDWGKESDETVVTITDYHNNIRDWAVFHGEYPDQVEEIIAWLKVAAKKHKLSIQNIICDKTSSGDPNVSMMKRITTIPVVGVTFTAQNKDKLAKKGIRAMQGKNAAETLSYPYGHKLRPAFEHQMRLLQKEFAADGKIKYHHPKGGDVHDDYPDSWLLSIWRIQAVNKVRTYQNQVF